MFTANVGPLVNKYLMYQPAAAMANQQMGMGTPQQSQMGMPGGMNQNAMMQMMGMMMGMMSAAGTMQQPQQLQQPQQQAAPNDMMAQFMNMMQSMMGAGNPTQAAPKVPELTKEQQAALIKQQEAQQLLAQHSQIKSQIANLKADIIINGNNATKQNYVSKLYEQLGSIEQKLTADQQKQYDVTYEKQNKETLSAITKLETQKSNELNAAETTKNNNISSFEAANIKEKEQIEADRTKAEKQLYVEKYGENKTFTTSEKYTYSAIAELKFEYQNTKNPAVLQELNNAIEILEKSQSRTVATQQTRYDRQTENENLSLNKEIAKLQKEKETKINNEDNIHNKNLDKIEKDSNTEKKALEVKIDDKVKAKYKEMFGEDIPDISKGMEKFGELIELNEQLDNSKDWNERKEIEKEIEKIEAELHEQQKAEAKILEADKNKDIHKQNESTNKEIDAKKAELSNKLNEIESQKTDEIAKIEEARTKELDKIEQNKDKYVSEEYKKIYGKMNPLDMNSKNMSNYMKQLEVTSTNWDYKRDKERTIEALNAISKLSELEKGEFKNIEVTYGSQIDKELYSYARERKLNITYENGKYTATSIEDRNFKLSWIEGKELHVDTSRMDFKWNSEEDELKSTYMSWGVPEQTYKKVDTSSPIKGLDKEKAEKYLEIFNQKNDIKRCWDIHNSLTNDEKNEFFKYEQLLQKEKHIESSAKWKYVNDTKDINRDADRDIDKVEDKYNYKTDDVKDDYRSEIRDLERKLIKSDYELEDALEDIQDRDRAEYRGVIRVIDNKEKATNAVDSDIANKLSNIDKETASKKAVEISRHNTEIKAINEEYSKINELEEQIKPGDPDRASKEMKMLNEMKINEFVQEYQREDIVKKEVDLNINKDIKKVDVKLENNIENENNSYDDKVSTIEQKYNPQIENLKSQIEEYNPNKMVDLARAQDEAAINQLIQNIIEQHEAQQRYQEELKLKQMRAEEEMARLKQELLYKQQNSDDENDNDAVKELLLALALKKATGSNSSNSLYNTSGKHTILLNMLSGGSTSSSSSNIFSNPGVYANSDSFSAITSLAPTSLRALGMI